MKQCPGPLAAALMLLMSAPASADGAFPNSLAVFAPADSPQTLFLATNFGLVVSTDSAQTWTVICEPAIGLVNPFLYSLGPSPDDRIFSLSSFGATVTGNGGCSWTAVDAGDLGVRDIFPDPQDPQHVLTVGFLGPGKNFPMAVVASHTGGTTFDPTPVYLGSGTTLISGVEVARANPQIVYLTEYVIDGGVLQPMVARSADGGNAGTWVQFDLSAAIGARSVRLAAIDPADPDTLYLRLADAARVESLGIVVFSADAGVAGRVAFSLSSPMSAFLRRSDGALIVGAQDGGSVISLDQGTTFAPWNPQLHVRGLAERGADLYVASDNSLDMMALSVSHDGGPLQALLQYSDICGPSACGDVPAQCAAFWTAFLQSVPPPAFCSADAGEGADAAVRGACRCGQNAPPPAGCGCATSGAAWIFCSALALGLWIATTLSRVKRRRRVL